MEWLEALDRDLLLWLNGLHAPALDPIMWALTQPLFSLPWFGFILWQLNKRFGWKGTLAIAAGTGLVVLFCDRVSVELFKEVFQRYRPSHNLEIKDMLHHVADSHGNLYRGGRYGFVSSHATNFFGMAFYFWLWLGRPKKGLAVVLFGWACVVSYTRIYLGVHYPGDIVAGGLLGIGLGGLAFVIVRWGLGKLNVKGLTTIQTSNPSKA